MIYYLTRNTNCQGQLSPAIDVWYVRPTRVKLSSFNEGYIWQTEDTEGMYGSYTIEEATRMFRTIPDTDRECVRFEQAAP